MQRHYCTSFPDIVQEKSRANSDQKEKIVRYVLPFYWIYHET